MAKIVIEIEDSPEGDGKVRVKATPNFEAIMKMDLSGEKMTAAHGYAVFALNQIRKKAQEMKPSPILIPRIRRN